MSVGRHDHIEAEQLEARVEQIISQDFVRGAGRWRTPRSTAQAAILGSAIALLPFVPGVRRVANVDPWFSVAALGPWVIILLVASAALQGHDPRGRRGTVIGALDTASFCAAAALLVGASPQIANVYWALFGFFVIFLSGALYRWQTHFVCLALSLSGLVAYLFASQRSGDAWFALVFAGGVLFAHRSSRVMGYQVARDRARAQILGDRASKLLVGVERDRIARELHDGVAAELTSALWMAHAGDGVQVATQIQRGLASLSDIVRGTAVQTGRVTELEIELHGVCRRLSTAQRPVQFSAKHEDESKVLDGPLIEHLVRVVQESVRNACAHANANAIEVRLRTDAQITVEVQDDGAGFDPAAPRTGEGSGGLRNLAARAEAIGGELSWPRVPQGTLLRLRAPLGPLVAGDGPSSVEGAAPAADTATRERP